MPFPALSTLPLLKGSNAIFDYYTFSDINSQRSVRHQDDFLNVQCTFLTNFRTLLSVWILYFRDQHTKNCSSFIFSDFWLPYYSYITKVFSGRVSGLPQTEIFCGLVKKIFSGLRVSVPLSALFFA